MQPLLLASDLLPSQQRLVQANPKVALLTLTPSQRTELIREVFTAIYADGQATESFKVLRAYISFFSLGMVEFAHVEKFSYR